MTRFLNDIKTKDIHSMKRHQPDVCPFKKTCAPVSYYFGSNKAGHCVGLMYKSTNLDCIRQCLFSESKEHKIECIEHFATPSEVIAYIHSLSLAVGVALDGNAEYNKYYDELCKVRDEGDYSPAEFGKK